MWKEKSMPENCPPSIAIELDNEEVFRVLKSSQPSEDDFKTYASLNPENERYRGLCKAYAISFYNSFENAKKMRNEALADRGTNHGDYIGKYAILKDTGKSQLKQDTGHYSIWFYERWDFSNFRSLNVEKI